MLRCAELHPAHKHTLVLSCYYPQVFEQLCTACASITRSQPSSPLSAHAFAAMLMTLVCFMEADEVVRKVGSNSTNLATTILQHMEKSRLLDNLSVLVTAAADNSRRSAQQQAAMPQHHMSGAVRMTLPTAQLLLAALHSSMHP